MAQGYGKCYSRIWWVNNADPAINENNLNKMDAAINELDDRVKVLDTTKADESSVSKCIVGVTHDDSTGIFTFKHKDGTTKQVDTKLEKIVTNWTFDRVTQKLVLNLEDGTTQNVDLSELITTTEFKESETIAWFINSDGKVSANIKGGSVTDEMIQANYLAEIKVQVSKADGYVKSAERYTSDADYDAKLAQSYSIGNSGIRDGEDTDNAKYYAEQACDSASAAATSESNAEKSASDAEVSADSASKSATNAASSASTATSKASAAATSASNASKSASSASISATNAAKSATDASSALTEIENKLASGEFKGDKGDTGAKGAAGADGVSVVSVIQTTTSNDDNGTNIVTITLSNGTKATFAIKNGSKGSKGDTGEKGEKGNTGSTGQRGSRWSQGTAITGTSTTATIFSGTGITDALVNDNYLNTSTGNTYRCTVAGNASTARWVYTGNIKGAKGDTPPLTNNLLATVSGTALDAAQGKVLCDKINNSIVVLNQTIITTSIAAATEATIAVSLPEDMDTLAIIPYVWIPTADWGTELKFQSVDVSAGTISAFAYGTTTQAYAVSYFLICRVKA